MDEVKTQIRVGAKTPPQQRVVVRAADVTKEDEVVLMKSAMGTSIFWLNTEHGWWQFTVERSDLGSQNVFYLVSAAPPGR